MSISWNGPEIIPVASVIITDEPELRSFRRGEVRREWSQLGFSQEIGLIVYPRLTANIYAHRLLIPAWTVAGGSLPLLCLLAIPPARSLKRHARRRRGLCPACGYDLRASPDRCPECGTPAAK